MTITESKLRKGTLTLGEKEFGTQALNVMISPAYKDDGDPVETLSGDTLTVSKKRSDTLKIKAIQDFTDPKGFLDFCWQNDLTMVTFSWSPSGVTGPTYSGKCEILAIEVGGDINIRLDTSIEFPISGVTTYKPATAAASDADWS